MKIIKKIICFLLFFALSVPLVCMSVSANTVSESGILLPTYEGSEIFNFDKTGHGFYLPEEYIDENGKPLLFTKNLIDTDVTDEEKQTLYGEKVSGKTFIKSPYAFFKDEGIANIQDKYIQFVRTLDLMNTKKSVIFNTEDEYYYFTFFYNFSSTDDFTGITNGSFTYNARRFDSCYTLLSTTPFEFVSSDRGYYLDSDSGVYCTFVDYKTDYGTYNGESFEECTISSEGFDNPKYMFFNSNLKYIKSVAEPYDYLEISKCYTNCNIDVSMFDNTDNLVSGFDDLLPEEDYFESISIDVEPEFTTSMNTNLLDDRWSFTVTNNSYNPIQFCAYVRENSSESITDSDNFGQVSYINEYYDRIYINSEINGGDGESYVIEPGYMEADWNYKVEADYYDYEISNDSSYKGFVVDTSIEPAKVHGITVWVYIPPGGSYSDVVYWKNMELSKDTEYTINFRSVFLPEHIDIATEIFDTGWMNSPSALEAFDFRETSWNTLDWTSDINISKNLDSYAFDFDDVKPLYSKVCSFSYKSAYTNSAIGGNGIISSGYQDDINDFNYKDSSLNLDTGKTTYGAKDKSFYSFDIDNASADDVLDYLDYTESFFSLISIIFSIFPSFIWGLIAFGLTAFVVIAIVKWIIT